jgi:hypothetical protein
MRPNLGTIDRVVRAVAGVVLLLLAFTGPKTPWGYVGLVLLVTSLVSFCPLYRMLGFSTTGRATPNA